MSKMVPGLRMPCGSNAVLIRRISASFTGSSSSATYAFFSVPIPCSPEIAPPSVIPAEKMSRMSSCRTAASFWNTERWTLPSPACPQPDDERAVLSARGRRPRPCTAGSTHAAPPCRGCRRRRPPSPSRTPSRALRSTWRPPSTGARTRRARRGPPSSVASSSVFSSRRSSRRSSSTTTRYASVCSLTAGSTPSSTPCPARSRPS